MLEEGEKNLFDADDIKKIVDRIDQGQSFKKIMTLYSLNYPMYLNSIV